MANLDPRSEHRRLHLCNAAALSRPRTVRQRDICVTRRLSLDRDGPSPKRSLSPPSLRPPGARPIR
eukprot:3069197-Pyramimonas_sp.AAC.1